jgi:hypothetical protein
VIIAGTRKSDKSTEVTSGKSYIFFVAVAPPAARNAVTAEEWSGKNLKDDPELR